MSNRELGPLAREVAVSVIAAVRDEEGMLVQAVLSAVENGYAPGVDVTLAVGPSRDRTAELAARLAERANVTVVENPAGLTPQGLNLALAASTGAVVVRIDGHTVLPPGYIARAVDTLVATGAANVGGRMLPVGETSTGKAIARAMVSRWGVGGAAFHVGGRAGEAASVFLGAFRREAVDAVGGFDERFTRAQDWELNHRLREAGYVVWFDPELEVEYRPRATIRALARQFHASGRWRREVVRAHPRTASPRYLAAPALVAALGLSFAALAAGAATQNGWLVAAGSAIPAAYTIALGALAVGAIRGIGAVAAARLPTVLATMHVAWGLGFWRGMP